MNKALLARGLLATMLAATAVGAAAQATPVPDDCKETEVVIGFFNGVQKTEEQALNAMREIREIYGDISPKGDPITYELLYNESKGFEDFVETFDQRLQEQGGVLAGRFELFFSAMQGGGTWWDAITERIPAVASFLGAWVDLIQAALPRVLTADIANPDTTRILQEHREKIERWTLAEKKLLLVAHSQGNLFVNAAYQQALQSTGPESVAVVHIAPASPQQSGPHTLADLDLVINGLRLVGSVPGVTDRIPGYLLRPPGRNGAKDILGHGLLEIYLNPGLEISAQVNAHIVAALNALQSPQRRLAPKPYPDFVSIPFTGGPEPTFTATFGGSHRVDEVVIKYPRPVTYERIEKWPYWRVSQIPYTETYSLLHGTTVRGMGVGGSFSCQSRQWDSGFKDHKGKRILLQRQNCTASNFLAMTDTGGVPDELKFSRLDDSRVGDRVELSSATTNGNYFFEWQLPREQNQPLIAFYSGTSSYETSIEEYKDWFGERQYRARGSGGTAYTTQKERYSPYGEVSSNFGEVFAWRRAVEQHRISEQNRLREYDLARLQHDLRQQQCTGTTAPPGDTAPPIDGPRPVLRPLPS